jgi:oligoribonuclease NrnB/cAMP/cGMP phosphodiesterase (DHH superfamily)
MENFKDLKKVVVIYHDQCRDGFGAAYAAWKKFGDKASYIPRKTQDPVPEGLKDKEIYVVDYSYKKPDLEKLLEANKSVVIIDHHETAKEAVTSFKENIFDMDHSGAVLAWKYFHPHTEVPRLLLYIEDHDLWRFKMEHNREFGAALGEYNQDFETWDQLNKNLEDRDHFSKFISIGGTIAGFEDKLVQKLIAFREKVLFEGHEIYAVNCSRIYRSIVAHELSNLNGKEGRIEMAIVYYRYDGKVHCSLRSNGDVDVRTMAEKYGGGGHKNASSIRVDSFQELPFTFL